MALHAGWSFARPVSHLTQTVKTVSDEKNFSIRATKESNDELGQLVDGFNEMISQIQQRDGALRNINKELEKRVETRAVELRPAVPDVVRHRRMLAREHLELVVPMDHLARGVDQEGAVEEPLRKLRVSCLCLSKDVRVQLARELAEQGGLITRNVDGQLVDVTPVIPVEDLVGEALQGALRYCDQPHGHVDCREPYRSPREFSDVLDVDLDVRARECAAHDRLQCKRHVLPDATAARRRLRLLRHPVHGNVLGC